MAVDLRRAWFTFAEDPNFWSSEQVCVVWLVNREDVIAKLVYTATNPVNYPANFHRQIKDWPVCRQKLAR